MIGYFNNKKLWIKRIQLRNNIYLPSRFLLLDFLTKRKLLFGSVYIKL